MKLVPLILQACDYISPTPNQAQDQPGVRTRAYLVRFFYEADQFQRQHECVCQCVMLAKKSPNHETVYAKHRFSAFKLTLFEIPSFFLEQPFREAGSSNIGVHSQTGGGFWRDDQASAKAC